MDVGKLHVFAKSNHATKAMTIHWTIQKRPPDVTITDYMVILTHQTDPQHNWICLTGGKLDQYPLPFSLRSESSYTVTVMALTPLKAVQDGYQLVCEGSTLFQTASNLPKIDITLSSILKVTHVKHTSRKVTIQWVPPTTKSSSPGQKAPCLYFIKVKRKGTSAGSWIFASEGHKTNFDIPIILTPGANYGVTVIRAENLGSQATVVTHKGSTEFCADLTKEELDELLKRSIKFISKNKWYDCPYFYRNKLPIYFDDIIYKKRGMMKVYIKDNHGDQASPINKKIKGLFFGVNVDPKTGLPPAVSLYGPMRFNIPAVFLFQPLWQNLYFADFYCINKAHYVTLVLTYKNTPIDVFCQEKLLKLDMTHNPFLVWCSPPPQVLVTGKIWVEVLYTEDIPLCKWLDSIPYCNMEFTESTGVSSPEGFPKRKDCKTCNLYPEF